MPVNDEQMTLIKKNLGLLRELHDGDGIRMECVFVDPTRRIYKTSKGYLFSIYDERFVRPIAQIGESDERIKQWFFALPDRKKALAALERIGINVDEETKSKYDTSHRRPGQRN